MSKTNAVRHLTISGVICFVALLAAQGVFADELPPMARESTLQHLRGQFDVEVRDDSWASIAEDSIRRIMEDNTLVSSLKFKDFAVECHTTTCRLLIKGLNADGPDYDVLTKLLDAIHSMEGFREERSEHVHRDQELGEFYFSREGFRLDGEGIAQ